MKTIIKLESCVVNLSMNELESYWERYQQILRWLETKFHKGEIAEDVYLSHVKEATRNMQRRVMEQRFLLDNVEIAESFQRRKLISFKNKFKLVSN